MLKMSLILFCFFQLSEAVALPQAEVLPMLEKALTPGTRDKTRIVSELQTVHELDASTVLAGLGALTASETRWSLSDVRSNLFLVLYSHGKKLNFDYQQRKQIGRYLSQILNQIANRNYNNAYNFALEWKSRLLAWNPQDYPLLLGEIRRSGVKSIGADIRAIALAMNDKQREDLRRALLTWFEYYSRNSEAEALVLIELADENQTVSAIRRLAEMYQVHESMLTRMYFPSTAHVPTGFEEDVYRDQAHIESHLAKWRNHSPILQSTELAEQSLALLNRKYHAGDQLTLRAIERANVLGPKTQWSNPQVFQEFLSRLRGSGFTVNGEPPREAALHAPNIERVDFVARRRFKCEIDLHKRP